MGPHGRRRQPAGADESYHTDTPNGYNLQISYVTHDNRLALANAVNPKKVSGSQR